MANSDTKNNVSGAPLKTGDYARASGGQNTGTAVSNGKSSNAYSTNDYSHTGGGNQNQDYGDGAKFPLTKGPEIALEDNNNGGAIQGGAMQATVKDKRASVK